jgi:hypothetical protein
MQILIRVFLSYFLVLSSLLPYTAKAEQALTKQEWARLMFSPPEAFKADFNRQGLYLDSSQRVVNGYRLIGFEQAPDNPGQKKAFREALRANNFILDYSPEQLRTNSRYLQLMNTTEGQTKLIRYYTAGFDALQVVRGGQVFETLQERYGHFRSQVLSENLFEGDKNKTLKTQLEINRRLMTEFSDAERVQAKQEVSKWQRLFRNTRQRLAYDFENGLRQAQAPRWRSNLSLRNQIGNLRGYTTITVEDPFGKKVDIQWRSSAQDLPTERGSSLMRKFAAGSFQTGAMGMALMVLIYGASEITMVQDFENNPHLFEESLGETMTWATAASLGSFFVGGAMVGTAAEGLTASARMLDISRKSKAKLQALAQNRGLHIHDPELKRKLIKAEMATIKSSSFWGRATSFPGLGGGFLISEFVYRYVDKSRSCLKVMGGLENGNYTPNERQQIQQSCDRTVNEIYQEIKNSPQTWMALTGLLSAKAVMSLGMNALQASRYAISLTPRDKGLLQGVRPLQYDLRIASRGLTVGPRVAMALGAAGSIAGFALFFLVFYAVMEGLEWGAGQLTLNMPATQAAENIRDLFRMYQTQGWDMNGLCDNRNLLQGGILDHLKPLAFWRTKDERCAEDLISAFLEQHTKANKTWRDTLSAPIQEAVGNWSDVSFKAMNLHDATYIFYKDISEQIKAQKNSGRNLVIRRVNNPKTYAREALGYMNTHLYNHPLPLFRSEPYFGWDYRLTSDGSAQIPYPEWNGRTTTWSERFDSRNGVDLLTERKDKFKDTVLPQVIVRLEERLNTVTEAEEKNKIERILAYLKGKNRNGVVTLENIAKGLHLISLVMENRTFMYNCLIGSGCFWLDFQKEFFDSGLWTVKSEVQTEIEEELAEQDSPTAEPAVQVATHFNQFEFMGDRGYLAGYQTAAERPFGVKPVGPGQGFFLRYASRLSNNNIDPYYYDTNYTSMTDYLLKQMVCGVDVASGQLMHEQPTVLFGLFNSPDWIAARQEKKYAAEFKAPKIPLKGNLNPCFGDSSNNRWRLMGPPGSPSFYNYIEDVNDPDRSYGGIVEFLYNEAGDEFVQNFEAWWQTYVEQQFVSVLNNLFENHYKSEVIAEQLQEIIATDNISTNCYETCREFSFAHKSGVAAAIKQEMDTYFTYFFTPLLRDVDLDLEKSDLTDQAAARQKLGSDFIKIRSEIYDIFAFASGKTPRITIASLTADYQDLLAEAGAEVLMYNPEINPGNEYLKLRALKALLAEKDYELRVLTRTDDGSALLRIYTSAILLLNEMTDLSEQQREELKLNIDTNFLALTQAFDDLDNRAGKVIFEYTDWPGDLPGATEEDQDLPSPKLVVVYQVHNQILALMDELIELQSQKELFLNER